MAKKHDHTGRSKRGERFVMLAWYLVESAAWKALKPSARALYIEIVNRYHGVNNGRIAFSVRQAADLCNINKDTASGAFQELQDKGFIEPATPGGFSRKTPHATEWRLTQYACDVSGAPPSKVFMKWRLDEAEKSKTRSPRTGQSVPSFRTVPAISSPKVVLLSESRGPRR